MQLELAVHLSLLSLANDWPLSLQHSKQLCQIFHRDIRKAMLYLQFMLSWQPSDPMVLVPKTDEIGIPEIIPILSGLYWPWRNNDPHVLDHLFFIVPSSLDYVSVLTNWRSDIDCIRAVSTSQWKFQPWTIKLEPTLVDELPENIVCYPISKDIYDTLSHLLYNNCRGLAASTNKEWYAMFYRVLLNILF